MSTPEAEEPPPRRPTGLGWPDPPPPPPAAPPPEPVPAASPAPAAAPTPEPPQRRGLAAERDTTVELPRQQLGGAVGGGDFASRAQAYRAASTRAPRPPYPLQPDRPGTVTAAAVILFIGAGLGLLACCGINMLAADTTVGDSEQNLLMVVSAVIVVFSLLNAVLGYFLLQGRQWARITTIVLCVIGILTSLISLFVAAGSDTGSGGAGTCFGIVLNGVIIGLLSGSSASDYFRNARG